MSSKEWFKVMQCNNSQADVKMLCAEVWKMDWLRFKRDL